MSSPSFDPESSHSSPSSLQYLSHLWAKKYIRSLNESSDDLFKSFKCKETPADIAADLLQQLRPKSLQAWTRTEALLSKEIVRHRIDPKLIDPWEVTKDAYQIYEKALSAYADEISPQQLSALISSDLGKIRKKHTAIDPRVIGFTSMQFHYTGLELLSALPQQQKADLTAYFKVVDDHLYMPLNRAYEAAAKHDYDSPILQVVRRLLSASTDIAQRIVARVLTLNPNYRCHHGLLSDAAIQTSSIRDAEMFQVYLWVCILENSVEVIQEELFPLCIMLYPRLNVSWELVRQLVQLLGIELKSYLDSKQLAHFNAYYQAMWVMFSPETFADVSV